MRSHLGDNLTRLPRIIDPLGNEIHIRYATESRGVTTCAHDMAIRPTQILYLAAGSAPKTTTAQILFNYEARNDWFVSPYDYPEHPNQAYYLALKSDFRLSDIFMEVRNAQGSFSRARSYHLKHSYDVFVTGQERKSILLLEEITESGTNASGATTALPAWEFDYSRLTVSNPVVGGGPETVYPRANLNVLTEARNGQGGTVRYQYAPVTNIPYTALSECAAVKTARIRVTAMELSDGLGNTQRSEYDAQSPLAWTKAGLGDNCTRDFEFGGYGTVTQALKDNGTLVQRTETLFHQELISNAAGFQPTKGKVKLQRLRNPQSSAELQRTENTWATQQNASTRNSPWVYQSEARVVYSDGTTQVAHRTRFGYETAQQNGSQFGNQTHVWEYTDDGQTLYRLRERWFYPNASTGITGQLAREYLYEIQGTSLLCKADTVYFFDAQNWNVPPTKGLLTSQYAAQSSCYGSWSITGYAYDTWGNPIQVRDPRGYTSTTSYDPLLHAYPVSATTPAVAAGTFTTRYDWDLLQGQVTTVTDPAGLRIDYRYDGLGRLLQMWKPGHNNDVITPTQSFEYVNYNSSTSAPMRILQRQRLDTGSTAKYQDSYTFYDGFGQTVQTRAPSPADASKHVVTLTRYNALGKPYQVYAPVEDSATVVYRAPSWFAGKPVTTTKYDALGRP
ncbi:MAG: RHS repeat protein, partial [Ardenticatenales bacterium]|nr:RHS repeat protein [Ardenticatenales bacterium]